MASLNINNHIKPSLEFVHRGTVVLLRYYGPFSNQRPFQSLHTRLCNRTGFCLKKHTQPSPNCVPSTWGSGHISSLQNFGKWREHYSEFFLTCEKMFFVGLLTYMCGLCWRPRLVTTLVPHTNHCARQINAFKNSEVPTLCYVTKLI